MKSTSELTSREDISARSSSVLRFYQQGHREWFLYRQFVQKYLAGRAFLRPILCSRRPYLNSCAFGLRCKLISADYIFFCHRTVKQCTSTMGGWKGFHGRPRRWSCSEVLASKGIPTAAAVHRLVSSLQPFARNTKYLMGYAFDTWVFNERSSASWNTRTARCMPGKGDAQKLARCLYNGIPVRGRRGRTACAEKNVNHCPAFTQ